MSSLPWPFYLVELKSLQRRSSTFKSLQSITDEQLMLGEVRRRLANLDHDKQGPSANRCIKHATVAHLKKFASALKHRFDTIRGHPLYVAGFGSINGDGSVKKALLSLLPSWINASSALKREPLILAILQNNLAGLYQLYETTYLNIETLIHTSLVETAMVTLWMDKVLVEMVAPSKSPLRRMLEVNVQTEQHIVQTPVKAQWRSMRVMDAPLRPSTRSERLEIESEAWDTCEDSVAAQPRSLADEFQQVSDDHHEHRDQRPKQHASLQENKEDAQDEVQSQEQSFSDYHHVNSLAAQVAHFPIMIYFNPKQHDGKCRAITLKGKVCTKKHSAAKGGLCTQHFNKLQASQVS